MTTPAAPVTEGNDREPIPELAFYYPNPMWQSTGWVKSLLLFFDGVGVLLPRYMREELLARDPELVPALQARGLLRVLEPEDVVDKGATEQLAAVLVDLITRGALDGLQASQDFHALSYSRLGYWGDSGLAEMLFEELEARGLARPSTDGQSIPMHPMVRALVLVLLAQILHATMTKRGVLLSPVTDRGELVGTLQDLLSVKRAPSEGHVIALDVEAGGIDLSHHPVDEVLDYRAAHGAEYRAYLRAVRTFVAQLSQMPEDLRPRALRDRREELRDLRADLRHRASAAWRKPSSIALSLLGALWTVKTGDVMGAALAAGAAALGAERDDASMAGAYSYLFGRGLVKGRLVLKA